MIVKNPYSKLEFLCYHQIPNFLLPYENEIPRVENAIMHLQDGYFLQSNIGCENGVDKIISRFGKLHFLLELFFFSTSLKYFSCIESILCHQSIKKSND